MSSKIDPIIKDLPELKLVGTSRRISINNNVTKALWQEFMPKRMGINHIVGADLYSVDVYDDLSYFQSFDPTRPFEKWAAMKVSQFENVPSYLGQMTVPEGKYAVFTYKGKPSTAQPFFQYIFSQWLPESGYTLDDRPHMAVMGHKYKGEDPESEEEIFIPIKESPVQS